MALTSDAMKNIMIQDLDLLSVAQQKTVSQMGTSKTKQATFASDTKDGAKPYTPLAVSKKLSKKNKDQNLNKRVAEMWARLSFAGQNEHLRKILDQFGLQGDKMDVFFTEEGGYLLSSAIIYADSSAALQFICDNISKDLVKELLRGDDYYALRGLLVGASALEADGSLSKAMQDSNPEKLSLLLTVDPKGVASYLENAILNLKLAEGVIKSCQEVLERYKSNRLVIARY